MEIKFIAKINYIAEGFNRRKVRLILPASFIGRRVSMVAQGAYIIFELSEDGNLCCNYSQGSRAFVVFSRKDSQHIDKRFLGMTWTGEVTVRDGSFGVDVTSQLKSFEVVQKAIPAPRKIVQVVSSSRDDALKAIKTLNDYAKANGYDFIVTDGKVSLSRSDVLAA